MMAFKQPRVPQMREGTRLAEYVREIVLFLKDFCLEAWTQSKRHGEEIEKIRQDIEQIKKTMSE
jgi:hypothetical protein